MMGMILGGSSNSGGLLSFLSKWTIAKYTSLPGWATTLVKWTLLNTSLLEQWVIDEGVCPCKSSGKDKEWVQGKGVE